MCLSQCHFEDQPPGTARRTCGLIDARSRRELHPGL